MTISRKVTKVGRDSDGDTTAIGNPLSIWEEVSKSEAISGIESDTYRYYVLLNGSEVDIHVVDGKNGKYLRTGSDETTKNNLDDLPLL